MLPFKLMSLKKDKILIIQTAFIGDVILATPIIESIVASNPNTSIDFLLRKGNESLLNNNPFVNEVLIWDKKTSKYANLFKVLKRIRKKKYDKIINVQRFGASGFLTWLSGAKIKIGFKKNPFSFSYNVDVNHEFKKGRHEVDRNVSLLNSFADKLINKPKLYPSKSDFLAIEKYTKQKYVCIAPSSVWFTKQLPQNKWLELISLLKNKDVDVYLLGGPGDKKFNQQIINQTNFNNIYNLAGELSFLQSAALMSNAEMNYTNDSAPMHMASSMNANITAIYCSTVPLFGFGPLSDNSFLLQNLNQLPCRPCGLHGKKECPLKHFKCAQDIKMTVNF